MRWLENWRRNSRKEAALRPKQPNEALTALHLELKALHSEHAVQDLASLMLRHGFASILRSIVQDGEEGYEEGNIGIGFCLPWSTDHTPPEDEEIAIEIWSYYLAKPYKVWMDPEAFYTLLVQINALAPPAQQADAELLAALRPYLMLD